MTKKNSFDVLLEDIVVTILAKVLTGIDEQNQPFWTDVERVRVANNLVSFDKWNSDAIGNLGNILTDALSNPISRRLVIKSPEYLYYSTNNIFLDGSTDNDFNVYYKSTDKNYVPNKKGSFQFIGKRFVDDSGKKWYSEKLRLLFPKENNETENLGDSSLGSTALYLDSGSGPITTVSKVIYSVENASGIFEQVKSVEVSFNNTNNTRVVKLIYNSF
jgi:hypothetical protein